MLTIDIRLNGRQIAAARITNLSALAPLSDYKVETGEVEFREAGLEAGPADFNLQQVPRLRSVWCLVEAVAQGAAAIREVGRRVP